MLKESHKITEDYPWSRKHTLLAKCIQWQDRDYFPSGRRQICLCLYREVWLFRWAYLKVGKNSSWATEGMDCISHIMFLTVWHPLLLPRCFPSEVSFPRSTTWDENNSWASYLLRVCSWTVLEWGKLGKDREKQKDVLSNAVYSLSLILWGALAYKLQHRVDPALR